MRLGIELPICGPNDPSGCTAFVARLKRHENREDMRMLRKRFSLAEWSRRGLNFPGDIAPSKKRRTSIEHSASGEDPTMKATEFNKPDPEDLAVRIRELAVEAHQALNNPFETAARMNDLSRRIKELRKAARSACMSEIDRWLHQVQQRVEERWPAVRLTTRA